VALVTETWLNSRTNLNIVNYDMIHSDSTRLNAGGVAIIINKQLKFHILPQINIVGCDVLLIKLQSNINLTVGVIYVPPKAQLNTNTLSNILIKHSPIVIGGDYNAKHKSWNNFTNNARGIQLYKFINNNDISVIHSNTYSYHAPHRKPSNIDLFLTKDVPYNYTCCTINDLTSNHLPVILKFDRVNIAKTEFTVHKTDWTDFQNRTDKWRIDYAIHSEQTIDSSIIKLQKYILNAYRRSSTYHHPKKKDIFGEADQAAISKLTRLRNYYRRKYQRNGSTRYRILRNVLNKHIKIALIECRNNYWTNKLKMLNTKNNSIWNILKFLYRKRIIPPPLILSNQKTVYDPQQKAKAIAQNFHAVYTSAASLTSPLNPVVSDYINRLEQDIMIPPIISNFLTPYVILNVVNTMSNKAPGQDKTTPQC